jgi:hypothetical protein
MKFAHPTYSSFLCLCLIKPSAWREFRWKSYPPFYGNQRDSNKIVIRPLREVCKCSFFDEAAR